MLRKTCSFLIVLFISWSLSAQVRPHGIGLVMSGGGAKGLYHIGVIEALEEHGIPIDYVAGTSMGSIIAAMYAAGYSPEEMRQIVRSGVVKEWATGRIDPNIYMPYYRQIARAPSFVTVRLDFQKGAKKAIRMPKNLISSNRIDLGLTQLFAPATAASQGDFNRLMVPFLCVASDMNQRRAVVLRTGELSAAVRASMSIPMVYKPMKRDDMILFDGGVYDNFPWQPLDQTFRPSFLIGSICTTGNAAPDEQTDIFDQAFRLAMQETNYTLPEGRSVTIARDVEVNMLDFDRAEEVMNQGYEDAMKEMPELLRRIKRRITKEEFEARRQAFRELCPPLRYNDYHLDGLNPAQREFIRDFTHVDRQMPGRQREMTAEELTEKLYEVLASGDFVMDFPHATYNPETKRYSFQADFHTKPNFRLSVGGCISSTAFNQAYIGMNYLKIGRVAQQVGAELFLGPLHTWGALGGRTDFYMWKPLYLDYSFHFSTRNLNHGYFGNLTRVNNALQVKESDLFGSLGIGMPIAHRGMAFLRANLGQVNYHYQPRVGEDDLTEHTRFVYFGLKAAIHRNTLDDSLYPRRGSDLKLSAIYVTGKDKYDPNNENRFVSHTDRHWLGGRFSWAKYFDMPSSNWFSFGINFDAVVTNHPDFTHTSATRMSLPVYAPIPHARMIYMPAFRGKRFVAAGIMPTLDLLPNMFFRTSFYTMFREQRVPDPVMREPRDETDRVHYIVDASLVYRTPIGPVSLSLTKYDLHSWKNMYLTFSFGYPLFAPKGTFY